MIVTHVYVKVLTQAGVKTLSDPDAGINQVLSVTVSDGVSVSPQGTVTLPLKNPSDSKPYKSFIRPGDLCQIEFHTWNGSQGGWYSVLHGPIRALSERTAIVNGQAQAVTQLTVGSMMDILDADQVALWMYLGGVKGFDYARSVLTPDQMNTRPHEVAFNWIKKAAFDEAVYNYSSNLEGWLHLDFGGLEANITAAHKLTLVEGSHSSIISQFLDSPIHEMYATHGTPADFTGDLTSAAGSAPGVKQAGAATILKWRAAPYPYCSLGGGAVRGEWDALPLHKLSGTLVPVSEAGSNYSLEPERNFFIVYPGYDYGNNEFFAYSRSLAVVNKDSIRRTGYRPLRVSSHLLMNDEVVETDLAKFSEELAWRVAGQWNNASTWENGTVTTPLYPWIKPGERLQAKSPWQSNRIYEYHVLGRQMSVDVASGGGQMVLQLERGVDTNLSPSMFAQGLSKIDPDAKQYSKTHREHDEPGV